MNQATSKEFADWCRDIMRRSRENHECVGGPISGTIVSAVHDDGYVLVPIRGSSHRYLCAPPAEGSTVKRLIYAGGQASVAGDNS